MYSWAGRVMGTRLALVGDIHGCFEVLAIKLALPAEVQEKVRAGDITVDHAYQISRLADRNVGPHKLTSLATKPVHATETVLKEAESRDELEARVSEIRAEGYKAAIVSRYWSDPDHTALRQLWDLDPDAHTAEPCHVIVLSRDWPGSPMLAIVETTQSRSVKIPTLGVLLSLVSVSFRSVFAGLGLVGA